LYRYRKLGNNILGGGASAAKLSPQLHYYVPRDYVDQLQMIYIVQPKKTTVAEIGDLAM